MLRGQIIKGMLYLFLEISFIAFMIVQGIGRIRDLVTLGTVEQGMVLDETQGIYIVHQGDNSMLMLLYGVVTLFAVFFFVVFWGIVLRSAYQAQLTKEEGKKPPGIVLEIRDLLDGGFHKTMLFLPVLGLVVITVMPLIYMMLMAFTNYDLQHQPPGQLFEWIGLQNFEAMLGVGKVIADTFWPILGWTLIWAVFATFTNYFAGMLLAILINSKGIRLKKLWRTIFVLTIAIPIFATLLGTRLMLGENGVINLILQSQGLITAPLPFLTDPNWARVTVIIVNMWVGIPHTMLITTGLLMNIPPDMYESAKIDGAGPFAIYRKITLPYMLLITTPYLITTFVTNINNFNVIYFLTQGDPLSLEYYKGAGKTDLLVTWLYKLTRDSKDYSYAATIGIIIFVISATISLIVFQRSKSYRQEETLQ
jgi:arabinogalactan oligomer/maltooligosaccharide transport system permease protein